jgi:hypothetical protein
MKDKSTLFGKETLKQNQLAGSQLKDKEGKDAMGW